MNNLRLLEGVLNMTSSFPNSPISEVAPTSKADDHGKKDESKKRNSWTKVNLLFVAHIPSVFFA
jgi:hypothetical protein